jgi:hypothetical protein
VNLARSPSYQTTGSTGGSVMERYGADVEIPFSFAA